MSMIRSSDRLRKIGGMMRRFLLVSCVMTILVSYAGDAFAHGRHRDGMADVTLPDGDPGISPAAAEATMPNQLALAMFGPCETPDCSPPPRVCSFADRIDRSNGPAPANATEAQPIYFLASDTFAYDWDRPVGCSDGSSREGTIGYSLSNSKKFMASTTRFSNAVAGRFFDTRRRNFQMYNKTFNAYEVIFFRASNPESYFAVQSFTRMQAALIERGFDRAETKYWIFGDVIRGRNPDGRVVLGEASHSDDISVTTKFAISYRRYTTFDGSTASARWGCADEYDIVPMQETLHNYHIVQVGRPDSADGDTAHVVQPEDVMHGAVASSYRGLSARGSAILTTTWDQGADTYTGQLTMDDPEYLTAVTGYGGSYQSCPNV